MRQLDSMEGLSTALRAQEHEFSNRLHVLSVLLELGEVEEATRYSRQLQAETALVSEEIRARVGSPVVAALLLAKTTVAAERDVVVRLDPASRLEAGRGRGPAPRHGARQPHRQRRRRRGRRPPDARRPSREARWSSASTCSDDAARAVRDRHRPGIPDERLGRRLPRRLLDEAAARGHASRGRPRPRPPPGHPRRWHDRGELARPVRSFEVTLPLRVREGVS